jgi:hypothetical protein
MVPARAKDGDQRPDEPKQPPRAAERGNGHERAKGDREEREGWTRAPRGRARTLRAAGQLGQNGLELGAVSRGIGALEALLELDGVEPPGNGVAAQQLDDTLAVVVADADRTAWRRRRRARLHGAMVGAVGVHHDPP